MSRAFIQKIGYFTPLSVKGCALWLDALDTTTVTLAGSTVTQWRDKSPTGSTLTVPSGCGGPTYTTDTSSKQCLSFVGSTPTTLQTALVINLTTSFFYAVFTCGPYPNDTPHRYIAMSDTTGGADYQQAGGFALSYTNPTSPGYVEIQQNSVANVNNLNSPASGSVLIVSFGWTGTTFTIYKNGTSTYTNGPYTKGNSAWLVLGSVAASAGTLAPSNLQNGTYTLNEFVGYSSYPTQTQQQSIEGYLAQKWGLTANLPANHLGRSQTFYTPGKNPGITAVPSFTMTNVPYTNYFPLSIAGCQLWLDGADSSAASMVLSGNNLNTWIDKSSNAYTCGIAVGSNATAPVYNTTTKAVQFVAVNSNALATPQAFGNTIVNNTATFLCVGQRTAASGYHYFMSGQAALPSQTIQIGFYNDNMQISSYGSSLNTAITAYSSPDPIRIYGYDINPTNYDHVLNGSLLNTGITGATSLVTAFTIPEIGRRYGNTMYCTYHDFNLFEMVVYVPALTTSQRQQVEGYLAWKWGTQSTLINTHPYYSTPPIEFGRPTQVAGLPLVKQITKILYVITNGLTNRWLFNEGSGTTFIDSVGGQNGTWAGSPAYVNVGGRSAVYLANTIPGNNATQYGTTTGGQPASIFATTNWSLAVWMYPLTYLLESADVFFGVGNYLDIYLGTASGQLAIYSNSMGTSVLNAAGTGVSLNVWSQVTLTCSNGTVTSYINGTSITTGTYTARTLAPSSITYIGAYQIPAFGVNMYLSDMRVYNRALTATEISQIVANNG